MKLKLNQIHPDQRVREQTETLDDIAKSPERWEDLMALANNIQHGIMFYPILVRKEDEIYFIVDGHRRWLATNWLHQQGLHDDEIEVMVKDVQGDLAVTFAQMTLDLQKVNFNSFEQARGVKAILDELINHGGVINGEVIPAEMKEEELKPIVCRGLGISMSRFYQIMAVLKISDAARTILEEHYAPEGRVRYIVPIKNPESQVIIAQAIVDQHLSNSAIKALATSLIEQDKGDVLIPKPQAILSEIKGINSLAKKFTEARNVEAQLVSKDPRTVASYGKVLPEIRQAKADLDEIIARLEFLEGLELE